MCAATGPAGSAAARKTQPCRRPTPQRTRSTRRRRCKTSSFIGNVRRRCSARSPTSIRTIGFRSFYFTCGTSRSRRLQTSWACPSAWSKTGFIGPEDGCGKCWRESLMRKTLTKGMTPVRERRPAADERLEAQLRGLPELDPPTGFTSRVMEDVLGADAGIVRDTERIRTVPWWQPAAAAVAFAAVLVVVIARHATALPGLVGSVVRAGA